MHPGAEVTSGPRDKKEPTWSLPPVLESDEHSARYPRPVATWLMALGLSLSICQMRELDHTCVFQVQKLFYFIF